MRRTPLSPLKIGASEWNRIQDASHRVGTKEDRALLAPKYVRAVGLNQSGANIVAGSPVYYGSFSADGDTTTSTVWAPYVPGYYNLYHAYTPVSSTEYTTMVVTNGCMYSRIGVALGDIADGAPGSFAIAGIVAVKTSGTPKGYARPARKTASYQTLLECDDWGVRVLCQYGNFALVDLDDFCLGHAMCKTKTGVAISANSYGVVYARSSNTSGWADTTDELFVFNPSGVAIPAEKPAALFDFGNRLCAFELCGT